MDESDSAFRLAEESHHALHRSIQGGMCHVQVVVGHCGQNKSDSGPWAIGLRLPITESRLVIEELENRLLLSTAYYVSPTGNDQSTGTCPSSAWTTINRVNQTVYGPAD
jgi:hypothetical protein